MPPRQDIVRQAALAREFQPAPTSAWMGTTGKWLLVAREEAPPGTLAGGSIMFDETRLREALALQRKSYELLRWANEAVKERRLKVPDLHHDMSASQAARSFLERTLGSLPPQARPEPDQIDEVAHLFASYLTTTFETAAVRRISDGCP